MVTLTTRPYKHHKLFHRNRTTCSGKSRVDRQIERHYDESDLRMTESDWLQEMATSPVCVQSCCPQGLCPHSVNDLSLPVQFTVPSQIGSFPGPKRLCIATPIRLNSVTSMYIIKSQRLKHTSRSMPFHIPHRVSSFLTLSFPYSLFYLYPSNCLPMVGIDDSSCKRTHHHCIRIFCCEGKEYRNVLIYPCSIMSSFN